MNDLFGNGGGVSSLSAFTGIDVPALMKAITTGNDLVLADATGGQALRLQNIDKTLQNTIWGENKIKLMKLVSRSTIGGPYDEWTEESDYGGPYGGTALEGANPVFADPTLKRLAARAKYYMTARQVTGQAMMTNGIEKAEAVQETAGARTILGNLERDAFFGYAAAIPEQMDGLLQIVLARGDSEQIIDLHGQPLDSTDALQDAASVILDRAGQATHFFYDPLTQADINNAVKTAMRFSPSIVGADGGIVADGDVQAINMAGGRVAMMPNLFLSPHRGYFTRSDKLNVAPTAVRGGDASSPAALPLTSVTAGSPTGSDGDPDNLPTGHYIYRVAPLNANGENVSEASADVAVTAGQHVPLTIVTTDTTTTAFNIYRSAVHASAAVDSCQYLCTIPATAGGTTVWNDTGLYVPGCTMGFLLDMSPSEPACDFRQWLPMTRFELANLTFGRRWLQMLFGYLRVTKPLRIVVVKNILSTRAAQSWAPLG